MDTTLPEFALILLVGPSGCGKTTFAAAHFRPTEVVSSDACRAMISDDENNQWVTREAFDLLHQIVAKRLAAGRLTVVDATNLQPFARRPLLGLAQEYYAPLVAIAFDLPAELCLERNQDRANRILDPDIIHKQVDQFRKALPELEKEGFEQVVVFHTPEEVESAHFRRRRLKNNLRSDHGPFDIIGDVHGCREELEELLAKLAYTYQEEPGRYAGDFARFYAHPEGRRAVFVGDIVDRGPHILDSFELVRNMVYSGQALAVLGNHDEKFLRKLRGNSVQVKAGLEKTLAELDALPPEERSALEQDMITFFSGLPSHYVFDSGKLVVAHAGIQKSMIGRDTLRVREFTLYGETTGETDEFGLPVRMNWAAHYHGRAMIVYGHTPVTHAEWLNRTINIDTGCAYGGKLTALRYPEKELVSIPSKQTYAQPKRPFQNPLQDGGTDES